MCQRRNAGMDQQNSLLLSLCALGVVTLKIDMYIWFLLCITYKIIVLSSVKIIKIGKMKTAVF